MNLTRYPTLRPYEHLIEAAAQKHGLDPCYVGAIIVKESSGRADVVNSFQAAGLMQVVGRENPNPVFRDRPTTAQLKDPATNLEWGCRILAFYLKRHGTMQRALLYYSGGPGAWEANGGEAGFEAKYWNIVQRHYDALLPPVVEALPPAPEVRPSVGPGVLAAMQGRGDEPLSSEVYLGSALSFTAGRKGLYVWAAEAGAVKFLAWG